VSTDLQTVHVDELDDGILRLQLDRPERLNAMSDQLLDDLHAALDEVEGRADCRVVVLTGAGRGFCAGLDLQEIPTSKLSGVGRVQGGLDVQHRIASFIPRLRSLRVPVIAAVNGPAAGGGLALALGSDVRIAAESARFGVAFIKVGLSGCDIGVSWLLPRLVGASRAHELMLTGRVIDSAEAERIGLVARVVPDDDLLDEALVTARQIRSNTPLGVWLTKEAMWSALEIPSQRAAIDVENRQQILASMTDDMSEAVAAFLGKREPSYGNR
jgi:enoyl-CoA hydratase